VSSTAIPVILNPTAGGGRLLRHRAPLEKVAADRGMTLEWWWTDAPGRATELAQRAAGEGRTMVLAFGGDGTYNEVARGLLGTETALAAMPGGTTSVLAYELGIPRPAERAFEALIDGRDRAMRVGRTDHDDLFLLMLSAGPDTVVLHHLMPALKRLGGRLGVAVQAVLELVRRRPLPKFRLTLDGDPEAVEGGWVIVGNGKSYGGPFFATPGADPFEEALEVVVQRRVGRGAAVPFFLAMARGRHTDRADVTRRSVQRVRIEPIRGGERPAYQVDGDCVGLLPVEAWVDPAELIMRQPGLIG